jgi:hypothetical protein
VAGELDELVEYEGRRVPYWWAERVAIAMESGATQQEAQRTANEELKRRKEK